MTIGNPIDILFFVKEV